MKKTIALGIAVVGTTLLALSLTVFGMGAAATLNPTATNSSSAGPVDVSVAAPTAAATGIPTPTVSPVPPAGEASEVPENADPMTSDKFMAMTPDEQANARDWMETQAITAACMKDQGYTYTFEPFWERDPGVLTVPWWVGTLPTDEQAGALLALDGDTGGGADYHWDDAGCYGYAVHVMGNDNAH
jgi:hypothetical protein